jgi:hypothetical protein
VRVLSEAAIDVLVATFYDDESRAHLMPAQRYNLKGGISAMLDLADRSWRGRSITAVQPTADAIDELDVWLTAARRTWAKMRAPTSRARAAMRVRGIALLDGRGNLPLSCEWRAVADRLTPAQRSILLPLIHYCNNTGVQPRSMANLDKFTDAHLLHREQKSAVQTVRSITNTWNEVAPTLGLSTLTDPIPYSDLGHYTLIACEFREPLLGQLDRCVKLWATIPRRTRILKPEMAEKRRINVLRTISAYCKVTGQSAQQFNTLEDFLTRSNVIVALEYMIGRAQLKNPAIIRTDGAYLCCRAVRDAALLVLPPEHAMHRELRLLVRSLTPGSRRLANDNDIRPGPRRGNSTLRMPSAKQQRALLPFLDETNAANFRALPARLYGELASDEAPEREFLTVLVYAAALELMMATSLWPCDVARLRLGRHLRIVGDGEVLSVLIAVPANETHLGVTLDFSLTGTSAKIVETYLHRIRPRRAAEDSVFVFPGRSGLGCHPNALGQAVCRLITAGTGHRICAKDIRKVIALTYGLSRDGSDSVVQRFLGRRCADNDPIINLIAAWRRHHDR